MAVPKNGGFLLENPMKMNDNWGPGGTPISGNLHFKPQQPTFQGHVAIFDPSVHSSLWSIGPIQRQLCSRTALTWHNEVVCPKSL